jgi:hypothetical protein
MRKASPSGHNVNISTHRELQRHLEPKRISQKLLAELRRKMLRAVIFICGPERAGEDRPKTEQTPKDHYLNRASGRAKNPEHRKIRPIVDEVVLSNDIRLGNRF